ncbi:MAG TPA: DUF4872 domain-containing protein [Anaerolineales bacterium]|nr:DUF4872 domain-containing protein [Anaerolineales bacterium]
MTKQKQLKRIVRSRMAKTGERYSAARRQVIAKDPAQHLPSPGFVHFPGVNPGSTALRLLTANNGIHDPHTGKPLSEAMAFGIAGGIGAGVFSFLYEKEDIATFFIAGRHLWQDDLAYLQHALARLGFSAIVRESTGKATAQSQLLELMQDAGPVVAWVDMASLPYRSLPVEWSGGGYHLIVVYQVDSESAGALIGDLAQEPIKLSLDALAQARARIKKDKNRLLAIQRSNGVPDLRQAVLQGLAACAEGLTRQRLSNFTLEAFKSWADRMHGSKAKDSWQHVFPPGHRLWMGLTSVYDSIEHYSTGGGLLRPLFAEFLEQAAELLKDTKVRALSQRYRSLGRGWSALASSALPDEIPDLLQAKQLLGQRAQIYMQRGAGAAQDLREINRRFLELRQDAAEHFPLGQAASEELRRRLKTQITELYEGEQAALKELRAILNARSVPADGSLPT